MAGGGVWATRLRADGNGLRFRIEMDTHMRDLDRYQFMEIVRVRQPTGRECRPVAVEKLMGGGHHRVAMLRFPALNPEGTPVELLVWDVAGVRKQVFRKSLSWLATSTPLR